MPYGDNIFMELFCPQIHFFIARQMFWALRNSWGLSSSVLRNDDMLSLHLVGMMKYKEICDVLDLTDKYAKRKTK